jgi:glycosyltransferase involved in cell wall biosynthesis
MRLLLTTDTVGGVWDYALTLARALEAEGHALLLAVVGELSDDQLAALPEGIAIECRNHRLEWLLAPAAELARSAEWLTRLARGWGAEVVHLNQMAYTGLAPFPAPTIVAVHSDACSWFSEVRHAAPPSEWDEYVRLVRAGLRAASVVVAPTRYQADLVRRHFGRVPESVIHNGAAVPSEEPRPRGEVFLITAGRAWDEGKGIAVLDRAIAILGDAAPPAHLLGDLEGPNGATSRPTALECHGRVPGEEARRLMSRASIYVAPSLYEPFGLSPLEAALRGCALVLSDIGSFRELWDGSAEFSRRGSAPSLAQALENLLAHPDRIAALAEHARARALTRYTADLFVTEYLSLYTAMRRFGARRNLLSPPTPVGPVRRRSDSENPCI